MDNFMDSAWYFLRYPSAECADRPFDAERTRRWLPVDMYIGGAEHAVLHLLYSRFITMALHDLGYLEFDEPFRRFRAHGLLIKDGAKMSKSRGNVVNPDELVERFGADTLRVALMFLGPFDQGGDYSDQGVGGAHRFLLRIWELVMRQRDRIDAGPPPLEARQRLHRLIAKVDHDIQRLAYNTAIAALMEYSHTLQRRELLHDEEVSVLLRLLAPFAPHLAEELWETLGHHDTIARHAWPRYDPALVLSERLTIPIQVNGKLRSKIEVPADWSQEQVVAFARQDAKLCEWLQGKAPRKVIYVEKRLLNFVL
jgi:leucyl-tRNA synthetase